MVKSNEIDGGVDEKLRQSREMLHTIFDLSPDAIAITRASEGEIIDCNQEYLNQIGYTRDEVIGHTSLELNLFSYDERRAYVDEIHKKKTLTNFEVRLKRKDNSFINLLYSTRFVDLKGEQVLLNIGKDITERKEMEEELKTTLNKYSHVNQTLIAMRHSSFAMMHATDEASYLDEVCKIIVDDCGYSMVWIGFTAEEGKKVLPISYSGFEKDYLKKLNITYDDTKQGQGPTGTAVRTGKPCICEDMHTDPKFKPWREEALKRGYKSSMVLPLKMNNKIFGALNIYSKEKNPFSEEEKNLFKELVDDISFGITSLRLQNANEKAEIALRESMMDVERSNAELEQFAYVASHDLREPLRMIISFLQLLERRYQDQLDEDANEFIGYAVNGAKRLDIMINDILEYSRISNRRREITPVNFEQAIEEALLNLKIPIEEANAVITHDPLPTIEGDVKLKVQLFQNLIGNSIKYRGHENPQIHISATYESDQYIFSVKDNGIGISPDHLNRIFTIFQRLHSKEEYEGTGIGLAIAQKIVQQQGGNIWVESEPGKGTTFYFTIPIK